MPTQETLEDKLREKFPATGKAKSIVEIVIPMAESDLVAGGFKDLIRVIKDYETSKGYGLLRTESGENIPTFYFGDSVPRDKITIYAFVPGQINVYYSQINTELDEGEK